MVTPKTVWVVTSDYCGEIEIEQVCTTKRVADAYAARLIAANPHWTVDVEEYPLRWIVPYD